MQAMLDLISKTARCDLVNTAAASQQFMQQGVQVAAACAACHHRGVASVALSCLAALIGAAECYCRLTNSSIHGCLRESWLGIIALTCCMLHRALLGQIRLGSEMRAGGTAAAGHEHHPGSPACTARPVSTGEGAEDHLHPRLHAPAAWNPCPSLA